MKKTLLVTLLLVVSVGTIFSQEWTGRKIMDEQQRRHESASEISTETMVLVDKNGNQEKRTLRKFSKELEEDVSRFLIVFDSPNSIKGTALLTWDNKDQEDDQWMYLPAQKRMRRIAKGSKKGYFMGTDFTFEDMQPEESDSFNYEILRSDTISKLDCWVIKATPANDEVAKTSGYSHRNLWVLKKYFFTVKIEFFDKMGTKIKTQVNGKLKKIDGQRYRANKAIMTNHKTDHQTIMEVESRKIDGPVDSTIFTERYITSGRHLR